MNISSFWSAVRRAGLLAAVVVTAATASAQTPKKLLVVTTTTGFRHSSIGTAEKVLQDLAKRTGVFTVDFARVEPNSQEFKGANNKPDDAKVKEAIAKVLAEKMSLDALKNYDGVIFANTTGDLPLPDREGFMNWLKSGKAFIGMHSATDTFHGYPEFISMIGGEFLSHGPQVTVECLNEDHNHPATRHFGSSYTVHDEIYLFKNFNRPKVHGLLTLDKQPNEGYPGDFPISWCSDYGSGKVFYTSLGHREDVWESAMYQKHIMGGIKWALGLEKGDSQPQSKKAGLSQSEKEMGFIPLFNGENLSGWKPRNASSAQSWAAQNGMLVNTIPKGGHGVDLVSDEKFQDFIVRYEYMVPSGSNSGLYLRGRYEVQVLEDYLSEKLSPGGNGGIYNTKAAAKAVSRAPGQWQEAEATIRGDRVTIILNGVKIHEDVQVPKATGGELDSNLAEPGPIMLQGDHGAIAFRNIRIKKLP